MRVKVARRHQITIPENIRRKAKISVGDTVDVSYRNGNIRVEKVDEDWENVMNATHGAWREHPSFKDMDDAVEIVNWMRGKV